MKQLLAALVALKLAEQVDPKWSFVVAAQESVTNFLRQYNVRSPRSPLQGKTHGLAGSEYSPTNIRSLQST